MYDSDVVGEEAIMQWAQEQKTSDDKTFLKHAAPLLQWLAEASEESDDEDSDGDDDDDDESDD